VNTKKAYQLVCKDKEAMRKAYQHSKCLNNATFSELAELRNKVNNVLLYTSLVESVDDIIPGICCGINRLLSQARVDMKQTCTKRRLGLPDTPDFIVHLVEISMGEMMDLMCSKFKTIADCEIHAPKALRNVEVILNRDKQEEADHSPITHIIDIVKRLDEKVNI
jgi:hypothetical protein